LLSLRLHPEWVFIMDKKEDLKAAGNVADLDRHAVRSVARDCAFILFNFFVLLASAGRVWWVNAWVITGLALLFQATSAAVLAKLNPGLLSKRGKMIHEGTKNFDKVFIALYIPISLSTSIVAGLDAGRFGWSRVPAGLMIFGVALFVATCAFGLWAMAVNAHFEMTVFVKEVGHEVCGSGPYKVVRHPAYAGTIIGAPSYPLILGSWWALVPTAVYIVLFIIRTALEDGVLRRELPGYKEYANSTRYRLMPFIW